MTLTLNKTKTKTFWKNKSDVRVETVKQHSKNGLIWLSTTIQGSRAHDFPHSTWRVQACGGSSLHFTSGKAEAQRSGAWVSQGMSGRKEMWSPDPMSRAQAEKQRVWWYLVILFLVWDGFMTEGLGYRILQKSVYNVFLLKWLGGHHLAQ